MSGQTPRGQSGSRIEVWKPGPDDSFYASEFPAGSPLYMRWVARTDGKCFPAVSRERALKKARRYLRDRDKARESREVLDA